ncbi:MAG TPA: GNAT family protein [Bacteroidales bacterium]|nr:GNAT family protein [Bacteroidales bacterium]
MIKGLNLILRAVEPSDVDLLYIWENDAQICKVSNSIAPVSRFVLQQYVMNAHEDIHTSKQLRLMIDQISGEEVHTIGAVDLFDYDPINRRAGVGILIERGHQGMGLAAEALELLIHYCFEILFLHQLYCTISVGNHSSMKLFQKHGFVETGLRREWLRDSDGWCDERFLQLINPRDNYSQKEPQ